MFSKKTNISIGGVYIVSAILGMVITMICVSLGGPVPIVGAAICALVAVFSMFFGVMIIINDSPD